MICAESQGIILKMRGYCPKLPPPARTLEGKEWRNVLGMTLGGAVLYAGGTILHVVSHIVVKKERKILSNFAYAFKAVALSFFGNSCFGATCVVRTIDAKRFAKDIAVDVLLLLVVEGIFGALRETGSGEHNLFIISELLFSCCFINYVFYSTLYQYKPLAELSPVPPENPVV